MVNGLVERWTINSKCPRAYKSPSLYNKMVPNGCGGYWVGCSSVKSKDSAVNLAWGTGAFKLPLKHWYKALKPVWAKCSYLFQRTPLVSESSITQPKTILTTVDNRACWRQTWDLNVKPLPSLNSVVLGLGRELPIHSPVRNGSFLRSILKTEFFV